MAVKTFNKAVYLYSSVCCKEPAIKKPCEWAKEDKKEGKFSEGSLGTWRCTRCRRKCKVTRALNKKEKKEALQEAA